jgi:hypothetical protein
MGRAGDVQQTSFLILCVESDGKSPMRGIPGRAARPPFASGQSQTLLNCACRFGALPNVPEWMGRSPPVSGGGACTMFAIEQT